jgi:two-component system sensor histidine kinase QseC
MSEPNEFRLSIRQRLVGRVLLVSSSILIFFLLIAYKDVHHETQELFDAELSRAARLILSLAQAEASEGEHDISHFQPFLEGNSLVATDEILPNESDERTRAGHYYETKLAFMILHEDRILLRSHNAPDMLALIRDPGYHTMPDDNADWRLFRLDSKQGNLRAITAERVDLRNELVSKLNSNLVLLFALMIIVLGIVNWFAIGSGLGPLRELVNQIRSRNEDNLDAVNDKNVPKEVSDIVLSLNRLFIRLGKALQRERHITSDAAHELRTPLAAVKLHAELARTSTSAEERDTALDNVIEGVNRSSHLVHQLLVLARLEPGACQQSTSVIELPVLVSDELSGHVKIAAQKNICLLDECEESSMIHGDAPALHIMLRNLLDNAIAYTQEGGTVKVGTTHKDGRVCMYVEDNGPGIAAHDSQRVFERFYRVENHDQPGCGIGLSIVSRVVELHQASIELRTPASGKGLLVDICFPAI